MDDNNSKNETIESDDECEIYFLKPVNEYNIMEKIKAANKELFSQDECNKLDVESSTDSIILQNNRKVSFARNLEEYEPQTISTTTVTTTTTTITTITKPIMTTASVHFNDDDVDDDNNNNNNVTDNDIENMNGRFEQKLEKVEEEQEEEEIEIGAEANVNANATTHEILAVSSEKLKIIEAISIASQEECIECLENVVENEITNFMSITNEDDVKEEYLVQMDNDEILEEICEEISLMNMEENNNSKCNIRSHTNQRKIIKQITFDYDCFDEETEHLHQTEDNESLTNLLTLDNDEEIPETVLIQNVEEKENSDGDNALIRLANFMADGNEEQTNLLNCYERLSSNEKEESNGDENANNINSETDDDDQLSIIVASYIQNDFLNSDKDKVLLTSDTCLLNQQNNNNDNYNGKHKNENKAREQHHQKKTFGKCFSFRGKITKEGMKQVKTENGTTDIRLHYKTCCEYKNFQKKLPKYTGYLSEYGLSHEQLMEREQKLQKRKYSLLQQTLRASEEELRKMQDNERAFVRWLKNKIRFPVNKTRNMFDVKRPFGIKKLKKNDIDVEKNDKKVIAQENLYHQKQKQNQRKSYKVNRKARKSEQNMCISKNI